MFHRSPFSFSFVISAAVMFCGPAHAADEALAPAPPRA